MLPFLAQFFESTDRASSLGTQTGTRANEDPDSDEDFPRRIAPDMQTLGTRTVTEVGGEEPDADIRSELATQTMTKVTNEDPDTDPGLDQSSMWEASVL